MTKRICKGRARIDKSKETRPCGRFTVADSDYCVWHNPLKTPTPKNRHLTKKDVPEEKRCLVAARRALLLEDSLVAVKMVAKGHGDPMKLCQNVLNRFNKEDAR